MGEAAEDRAKAAELPEGDVIRILLEQHARIRDLFSALGTAQGSHKKETFDELRSLLAVHETAEEMILRPVSKKIAGEEVAAARNQEEAEANEVLQQLEGMDVDSPDFARQVAEFEKSVDQHAEAEEHDEFPEILRSVDADERQKMGKRLQSAEKMAPTHPHPSAAGSPTAQYVAGPFAAMVDRVRDALKSG